MIETPTETPLDRAKASGDQMQFYSVLAGAELFLLLTAEAEGDKIAPEVFETEEGTFVLAFDREVRLSEFASGPAPYAALTGRAVAEMLAGQGVGLALNPGGAPSTDLLPPEVLDWMHQALGGGAEDLSATPTEIAPPRVPEGLVTALDLKLSAAAGLARAAYLVCVTYTQGAGHLLAFVAPVPGAEPALTQAANEALIFSGIEAGALDVAFFDASDPMAARLAQHGLRFDLPQVERLQPVGAPGMDPEKPPRLH